MDHHAPSPEAALDAAAKAAATAPQHAPRFRIVQTDVARILEILIDLVRPASVHLDAAFRGARDAGKSHSEAVRDVAHFETLRDWVAANHDHAAKIVQCAVYLGSGRYVAQEEAAPEAEQAPPAVTVVAEPTPEAATAG